MEYVQIGHTCHSTASRTIYTYVLYINCHERMLKTLNSTAKQSNHVKTSHNRTVKIMLQLKSQQNSLNHVTVKVMTNCGNHISCNAVYGFCTFWKTVLWFIVVYICTSTSFCVLLAIIRLYHISLFLLQERSWQQSNSCFIITWTMLKRVYCKF